MRGWGRAGGEVDFASAGASREGVPIENGLAVPQRNCIGGPRFGSVPATPPVTSSPSGRIARPSWRPCRIITEVMNTIRFTARLAITGVLLVGLTTTSVYPRLMAADGRGRALRAIAGQTVCCCGTKDGRCCGTACCQLPTPRQEKSPALPSGSDDRSGPLGLPAAALAKVAAADAISLYAAVDGDSAPAGRLTLHCLNVRLNI